MASYVTLFIIYLLKLENSSGEESLKDYCAHEYFNPSCPDGKVIVIKKALFGRMELNRCLQIEPTNVLKGDPKYFGCSSDVSDILTEKCSGLQRCNIHVTDPDLLKKTNCYKDVTAYLKAYHSCFSVYRSDVSCSIFLSEEKISILNYSNFTKTNIKCGTIDNPWHIETSVGQNIEISMLLLRKQKTDSGKHLRDLSKCHNSSESGEHLGNVIEDNRQIHPICKINENEAKILTSSKNKITIVLKNQSLTTFILSFKATGCHDLKPPKDGWMKREENDLTVGCYMNRHTWKLACKGKNWVGVIGNCSEPQFDVLELKKILPGNVDKKIEFSEKVFAIVVVVLLIILLFFSISCGLLIIFQRSKNVKFSGNTLYGGNADHFLTGDIKVQEDQIDKMKNSHQDSSYYVLEKDGHLK